MEPIGWFPAFTLMVGYAAKWLEVRTLHKQTIERERETRRALRRDALNDRRADFQRRTLLELQTTALDLARWAGKIHLCDRIEFKQSGLWHKKPYPDDLNENLRQATAQTSLLTERIHDAKVRDLARLFRSMAHRLPTVEDIDKSDEAFGQVTLLFQDLQERIGVVLRALDEDSKIEAL